MLNWSNTLFSAADKYNPSSTCLEMPGFVKDYQEKTGHYYMDLFLCNTNLYSETFITAQQSKNMLHQNCTRKSRTPVTAGEKFADKNQN